MANDINIAFKYAIHQMFKDGIPPSFKDDNCYHGSVCKLGIYYADDNTPAGSVTFQVHDGKYAGIMISAMTSYGNEFPIFGSNTFASSFNHRPLCMASVKDKTKWKCPVSRKPEWKYDEDEWNTYFKDAFDSNWDDVGKYLYEKKSSIWCDMDKHTYRNEDSDVRWVIMKDGMLLNLANYKDKSEFDGTVTLKGIPIQYIVLHMLPRVSKFVSKVEVINKLKLRTKQVNEYAKSVYAMTESGDIVEYKLTSCRMSGEHNHKDLNIAEIQSIIDSPNVWVKCLGVLKRVPL